MYISIFFTFILITSLHAIDKQGSLKYNNWISKYNIHSTVHTYLLSGFLLFVPKIQKMIHYRQKS
jgi:hypothetical protein